MLSCLKCFVECGKEWIPRLPRKGVRIRFNFLIIYLFIYCCRLLVVANIGLVVYTSEHQNTNDMNKAKLHCMGCFLFWLGWVNFLLYLFFWGVGGLNTIRGRVASVPVYLISDVAVDVASTRTKNLTLN